MDLKSKASNKLKQRVFIVDDHFIVREGLAQLINRENDLTVCGEAGNIPDALQAIPDADPDVLIVDLTLEDGNGIRLIENFSCSCEDLLILVFSMHDEAVFAERCLKAGAKGYIMKQESSSEIIAALRKVLSGKLYLSDRLSEKFLDKLVTKKTGVSVSSVELLSNRELEVYQLIGQGMKKREIAEKLNLSIKTVENYIEYIKRKMNLSNSHEVVMHAVQNGMF